MTEQSVRARTPARPGGSAFAVAMPAPTLSPVSLGGVRASEPRPVADAASPVRRQSMRGPRGWAKKYQRRLAMTDAFVVALTMMIAHGVRFGWEPLVPVSGVNAPAYILVTVVIAAAWVVMLGWTKSRDPSVLGHGPQEFQRVVHASWLIFASVALVGFMTQWQISRGYLLVALPVGIVSLLGYRAAWRYFVHSQRDRGELRAQCVVVGSPSGARQMIARLNAVPRAGYAVVGACLTFPDTTTVDQVAGVPVLGGTESVASEAERVGAEYVIVSGADALNAAATKDLSYQLERADIGLIVVPAIVDVAGPRVSFTPVEGLPLMHVDAPRFTGGKYALKGALDRIAALVALVVLALPMMVVAFAVVLDSRGPVVFRQERVGVGRRPFVMYKFRTMHVGAERQVAEMERERGSQVPNAVLFKLKRDPRVTRVGRFLRRFSIDELPQLVNVVKGDMSLVGPRPPLDREVRRWEKNVDRRQLVKPGLTGLWQVSGRSDLDWEQSVRLDLYYAENWSIAGDFVIVCRTVWAVVAGRGAY
ncbi:sugar transferase [Demequina globuliformis]|uniref:sugar transferase n=1 Tax=Demequina globuliformis TaxID=676202 RepID=UPI0007835208|nr:sugar transferase [Demequina globuliformis]